MNKQEIKNKLKDNHRQFTELVFSLNDHDFLFAPNEKWTAGQQLDHINRSVGAVKMALTLPKFMIRLIIGKANRASKEYETLVDKYKLKLEQGGRAGGRYLPKAVEPARKKDLGHKLLKTVDSLCKKIDRFDERELDYYILPHPLLGKLTLREMLYFTIYHAQHHQKLILKYLGR